MKNGFITIYFALLGLLFGSLGNVVIYRLPRGQSLTRPARSYCPRCEHGLSWRDLVPVFSWLLLRRQCRYCGEPISARYPCVEAACAALFGLIAWYAQPLWAAGAMCVLALCLLCLALIDWDTQTLPDGLHLVIAAAGALYAALSALSGEGWPAMLRALLGAAAGAIPLLVIDLLCRLTIKKDAFGYGDMKLMAAAGLFLSWQTALLALLLAFVTGGLAALVLRRMGRLERGAYVPFVPALGLGILTAALAGEPLIAWYLGLLML